MVHMLWKGLTGLLILNFHCRIPCEQRSLTSPRRTVISKVRPRKKKIDVSRPDFFQKGGGRFLLFTIFTIFTISYLLVYYEFQATITFTGGSDTHSTCYNCM